MAITSAVCTSFKVELLKGVHNFTATTGNTFKIALYTSSATLGASTTAYGTSNEITNTSGTAYTAGGASLTNVTPVASSTTAVCDFSDVSYTDATFTANGCLIYNDTATGDPACVSVAFGGDKTVTAGTFTIQFPTADATNAIIRIA
jgi:hypothetical protein|tara:strand:+ start:514 stop:954 length:441 start_codon:yes stop_codon:yes gene_type:complete